jgi:1-phosphofructokinase
VTTANQKLFTKFERVGRGEVQIEYVSSERQRMTNLIVTVTLNPAIDYTVCIPALSPGSSHRATRTLWEYAGKGFNVSKVISRLGGRSIATGFLYFEDLLQAQRAFETEGIKIDCITSPGRIRVNVKLFDESQRIVTELNATGVPAISDTITKLIEKVESLSKQADAVVLSGSLPPNCPSDIYQQLINRCQPHCPVILDASGDALRSGILARPRVVKPNRDELAELVGRKLHSLEDIAQAAEEIAHRGVEIVLASLDKEGAIVTNGRETLTASVIEGIEVCGTVGAGDSMVAGYVTGLVKGMSMEECFVRAMAAATVAVSNAGTGNVKLDKFEEILPKVTVKRLAG